MSIYGRSTSSCAECGKEAKGKEFCSAACRSAWHNRRTRRGALLYDLAMIELVEPELFVPANMAVRRAAQLKAWRAEDEKAGRKRTYQRANKVAYALPLNG